MSANGASNECLVVEFDQRWRTYKSRWFVLFVVTFANIAGGMVSELLDEATCLTNSVQVWIALGHTDDEAKVYYSISGREIDVFAFMFLVTVVVLGPVAMWTLDHKGLKFGLRIGAALLFAGMLVRGTATSLAGAIGHRASFVVSVIGQVIAGCGQPFVQFTPSKVAESWFSDSQRLMATTAVGMSTPVGLAIGSITPPLIVDFNVQRIELLTWLLAVPCAVSTALVMSLRRSRPPSPPSMNALITSKRPFLVEVTHVS